MAARTSPGLRRGLGAIALALLSLQAAAQARGNWALKLTPQHLILSGLWLEAEQGRAEHSRQTFTLGAQLYAGLAGHPDVSFGPDYPNHARTVRGAGLLGQQRFYLGTKMAPGTTHPLGLYWGYGPQVQLFRLSSSYNAWYEEPGPGNLPYLVFGPVAHRETVLRYGAAAQIGYQLVLTGRLLVDVYAGLGLRKSHYWADSASQFRTGSSDYAHEGLYFPAGFKLGVVL